MSKFVDKIDELIDEYDTSKDVDVLEAVIELIEDEMDKSKLTKEKEEVDDTD